MKILHMAPYAYLKNIEGFKKNKSGLAYMVSDICRSIAGQGQKIYLVTQSSFTDRMKTENIYICRKKLVDILKYLKPISIAYSLKAIYGLKSPLKYKLRVILYFLSQGCYEHIINSINPDLVHIHSIGFYTIPFILACVKCETPFVVTLHGMISDLSDDSVDDKQKQMEKAFCLIAEQNNIPVTVISTGVKNRMKLRFGLKDDTLKVITNGVNHESLTSHTSLDLQEKYKIKSTDKVIVCVGNICERKNQMQVVRAYMLLEEKIRKSTKLLFLGKGPDEGKLQIYINEHNLQEDVYVCGHIDRDIIDCYYNIASINVTASKDEGFGLPIIEAFTFGIPTVTFSDLDAVEDLYSKETMVIVPNRSDEDLAMGMSTAIKRKFNKDLIKKHAKNYSIEYMAQNYIKFYKNSDKISNMQEKDVLSLLTLKK